MKTIELERYIAAFETWARVADQDASIVQSIARVAEHLRKTYRGQVAIDTLCQASMAWLRAQRLQPPDVHKSCLLGRLIYSGEELRTRPCPIHQGEWSGCAPHACPAGCGWGQNLTGWLPNDYVEAWPVLDEDPQLAAVGEAVRESFCADHLAVYADRLIALGDPRGELITLELAMRDAPTDEQRLRHEALLATCFGDLRSTAVDEFRSTRGVGARAAVELGFLSVDAREVRDLRKIYDAHNGRYLRKLAIRGEAPMCRDAFAMLSLRTHAWLDRITIVQEPMSFYDHDYDVSAETTRAVFAATPCLTSLAVTGRRVISAGELPVRWLWMSDLESVIFESAPQLATLVLAIGAFGPDFPTIVDEIARRAPVLEAIHVPATVFNAKLAHPRVRISRD